MGRLRGVKREETVRLELSDGDWIDIRRHLTVGEERDIVSRSVREVKPDGSYQLDNQTFSYLAAAIYIVGWSFLGVDGQPIKWPITKSLEARVDVLRNLDRQTLEEIEAALTAYKEREEALKNVPDGGTPSEAISPSAS
jgi:hypothetical protein